MPSGINRLPRRSRIASPAGESAYVIFSLSSQRAGLLYGCSERQISLLSNEIWSDLPLAS